MVCGALVVVIGMDLSEGVISQRRGVKKGEEEEESERWELFFCTCKSG